MNKLLAGTLVSVSLIAASAVPALAQTVNPPTATGAQPQQHARHQRERRDGRNSEERLEERLEHVRSELKITDAQQPQWNAFAETLRKQAAARDKQIQSRREGAKQRAQRGQATAVDRLERRQQRLAAAAAQLNERLAVQKPLYEALTAEQKRIADKLLASRGGDGKSRHRGRHRTV